MRIQSIAIVLSAAFLFQAGMVLAQHPDFKNSPYFGRNDKTLYKEGKQAHGGAGSLDYVETTKRDIFKSNFIFLHKGIMRAKSGIGEHAHRYMEEMYFVLDRYAEFTVNGITSEVPSVGMVLCPKGSSHGIYNPSDHPVEWMNWGISDNNREYDAVNFNANGNDLINQPLVSPPPFQWAVLSKDMLHPQDKFFGGKGTVFTREVWGSKFFGTNQEYLCHYLVPAGASIGLHRHDKMEVVWYILKGKGRGTVNGDTYDVRDGDSMACPLGCSIGIYNNSKEDLEIIAVGVSMKKGETDGIVLGDDLTKK